MKDEFGELGRVTKWLRAVGYVQTAPWFHDYAKIVNGFSDLIIDIWGEVGRIARRRGEAVRPLAQERLDRRFSLPFVQGE